MSKSNSNNNTDPYKWCNKNMESDCCKVGMMLSKDPQLIMQAQQNPDKIDAICYALEKQPFNIVNDQGKVVASYPTTGCNRQAVHSGCSHNLHEMIKLKK